MGKASRLKKLKKLEQTPELPPDSIKNHSFQFAPSIPHTTLYVCFAIWMLIWLIYSGAEIKTALPYYKIAMRSSMDQLREMHCVYDEQSMDYYQILSYCSSNITENENIQLVLPQTPENRYYFLREKGRYFLYPRNFGNNQKTAKYILVYGVRDFVLPENYKMEKRFAEDKYLLVNSVMTK